jgi:hypothetical protein
VPKAYPKRIVYINLALLCQALLRE